MKFTFGYLLGAGTVLAIGASFIGGVGAYAWAMDQKAKTADDIKNEDLMSIMRRIRANRSNN